MTETMPLYSQKAPEGFTEHSFEKEYELTFFIEDVWRVLLRKNTFTDHQVWPYRVEFLNSGTDMEPGEENIHHGPLMSFAGIMGDIQPPHYRDLRYFYGSYFLSMRLIRPSRLQIWLTPGDGSITHVKIRIDSWVKPFFMHSWTRMQKIFWAGFGKWIGKLTKRSLAA
jgi:hypothetical protein